MRPNIKHTVLAILCAFAALETASAALTTLSFQPNPVDLNDLDHHYSYSWRMDNINLNGLTIQSATISFANIANWDSNPNMLFVYLMDTAMNPGVAQNQDHPLNEAPIGDITDHFANGFNNGSLLTSSTARTKLFQQSFTTTPTNFTYTFTAAQIATLTQYINNGHDVALGFDPECHFFNDGITFTMTLAPTPVPEATTFIPVVLVAAAAIMGQVRRRRLATA